MVVMPSFPLAMEKVLVYWYTREHHVTTDSAVRYAQKLGSSPSEPMSALDKPLLVLEMASIAELFGDRQLESTLVRRFRSLITYLKAIEFASIFALFFEDQFDDWALIDGIRDLLALHAVRKHYDRTHHPEAYIITEVMDTTPKFKKKMIWVAQADATTLHLPVDDYPEEQTSL